MPTEYRKDRKKWGYRFCQAGITYKKYAWDTKAEAKQAEAEFLTELKNNPPPPKNTLAAVCSMYLVDSAPRRSKWRIDALHWTFNKWVLPYFGADTVIITITFADIEKFILHHKKRGVSNKTIWNYIVDIRALFNWGIKHRLARSNPVNNADLSMIKNRKPKKSALDLNDIEFARFGTDRLRPRVFRLHAVHGLKIGRG